MWRLAQVRLRKTRIQLSAIHDDVSILAADRKKPLQLEVKVEVV